MFKFVFRNNVEVETNFGVLYKFVFLMYLDFQVYPPLFIVFFEEAYGFKTHLLFCLNECWRCVYQLGCLIHEWLKCFWHFIVPLTLRSNYSFSHFYEAPLLLWMNCPWNLFLICLCFVLNDLHMKAIDLRQCQLQWNRHR